MFNQFNNVKYIIICDVLLKIAYIAAVTVAAIFFNKPSLLLFYLLVLLMGHNYYSKDKESGEKDVKQYK